MQRGWPILMNNKGIPTPSVSGSGNGSIRQCKSMVTLENQPPTFPSVTMYSNGIQSDADAPCVYPLIDFFVSFPLVDDHN